MNDAIMLPGVGNGPAKSLGAKSGTPKSCRLWSDSTRRRARPFVKQDAKTVLIMLAPILRPTSDSYC